MNRIFQIVERVRTPLTLAALTVVVLYAVFKAVLALDIFESVGSEGTIALVSSVIDKLFYLALAAIVLGLGAYITSLFVSRHTSMKIHGQQDTSLTPLSEQLVKLYSLRVSDWFTSRYAHLDKHAEEDDLKTNTTSRHAKILPRIAQEVDGFPGGIYTLNQDGVVIHQSTPNFPTMPDIVGYDAGHKEYFVECQRKQKPVVCNSFTSANRKEEVLVVAVPRYDANKNFIGVLDAVIDLVSSPFSEIANDVVATVPSATLKGRKVNLCLLDKRHVVLGSSNDHKVGHTLGGNRALKETVKGNPDPRATRCGAVASVKGTPFVTFAYWG